MRRLAGVRVQEAVELRKSGERDQPDPQPEHQYGDDANGGAAGSCLCSNLHEDGINQQPVNNASPDRKSVV